MARRASGNEPTKFGWLGAVIACLCAFTGRPRSYFRSTMLLSRSVRGPAQRKEFARALSAWPPLRARGVRLTTRAFAPGGTVGDLALAAKASAEARGAAESAEAKKRPAKPGGVKRKSPAKKGAPKKAARKAAARKIVPRKKAVRRRIAAPALPTPPAPPRAESRPPPGFSFMFPEVLDSGRIIHGFAGPTDPLFERESAEDAAPAPPLHAPRYANAVLRDPVSDRPLDPTSTLSPGSVIRLRLDIGALSAESHVDDAKPIPEERLPRNIDLDVMVSSGDFAVARHAQALGDGSPSVAHGGFFLPDDGGAARARDGGQYVDFYLKVPAASHATRPAHARIGYYYKNILIQSQHLTAWPDKVPAFTIVTDFTTSDDLTDLDDIPSRLRLSILTNANGDGGHQIVLRHPGEAAGSGASGFTMEMKSANIGATIKKMRAALTMRAPEQKKRNAAMFAEDLRQLAPIGWDLYTQLPGKAPPDFFGGLRQNPDQYVIQIARPNTSSFVLPWSYVYDIPLIPGENPTLCPMVAQWDGAAPLFEDAPRQCPCGPHSRNTLCPFGFWGYRYAIEQLASSDKRVTDIPASPTCDIIVGEAQYDIDLGRLGAHVGKLGAAIARALPQAKLREGKDKAALEKLLGADLPFIYFYCHGERRNDADPNTVLGVGDRETLTTGELIAWVDGWYQDLNKQIWNAVRPLVFINACHTLAMEPETLVTYLDVFVGKGRAAGVIGTEVKVEQNMAMDVAEQFVAAWMGGDSVENVLRAIRVDYLKQGNLFGLVYTPYCWSELKIVRQ
jgi:hypothetical protein